MTEVPTPTAFANTRAIAVSIGRCAESLLDVDRLRGETNALKNLEGELATFAACLFELECAKKGDADGRANMLDTADQLLTFWRDRSGDLLAAAHPTLSQLWSDASAMLVAFEKKRIDRALTACWEARADATLLQQVIVDLTPVGDRRVEFATCLYHLELARLFVDSSRAEFASRIQIVNEAYADPSIAQQLVGDDAGLKHLWTELIPYLDEFFEAQEQEEEKRKRAETDPNLRAVRPPSGAVPAAPQVEEPSLGSIMVPEAELLTSSETSVDEVPPPAPSAPEQINSEEVEIIDVPEPVSTAPAPPPPPKTVSADSEVEVIELEEAPVTPPPRRPKARDLDVLTDYEPGAEAQAFWQHTEVALGLLPDSAAPRAGARVLSADSRGDRKKLNAWLDNLPAQFSEVPEAKAMQCLMRLYMAAQIKEKTLFGQKNMKRVEAFRAAFGLLSADGGAAGRAAVWFDLDGAETVEHLQVGLELVADYLQFCARQNKDPLDGAAADEFLGV